MYVLWTINIRTYVKQDMYQGCPAYIHGTSIRRGHPISTKIYVLQTYILGYCRTYFG